MESTCRNLPSQTCNCIPIAPLGMEQEMEFLERPRTPECETCFAYPKAVDPIKITYTYYKCIDGYTDQ